MEAQTGCVVCPKSHRNEAIELEFKPWHLASSSSLELVAQNSGAPRPPSKALFLASPEAEVDSALLMGWSWCDPCCMENPTPTPPQVCLYFVLPCLLG